MRPGAHPHARRRPERASGGGRPRGPRAREKMPFLLRAADQGETGRSDAAVDTLGNPRAHGGDIDRIVYGLQRALGDLGPPRMVSQARPSTGTPGVVDLAAQLIAPADRCDGRGRHDLHWARQGAAGHEDGGAPLDDVLRRTWQEPGPRGLGREAGSRDLTAGRGGVARHHASRKTHCASCS